MWLREYSELIRVLTLNQLKVKYQSSALGIAWSFLNPLLMMSVLYVVFVNVFGRTENFYAIYILIGIISWRFFASTTTQAMSAIVGNSTLVTKIYLPRQILVLTNVFSSLIQYSIELSVLFTIIIFLGPGLTWTGIFFPLILFFYFLITYGVSLVVAALYVYYRDLNQIWGVLMQIGFFTVPVIYQITKIPEAYLQYYMLNPLAAIMVSIRASIFYGTIPELQSLLIILATAIISIVAGTMIFVRLERRFAEEV